jgi:hypothetical protein
MVVPVELMIIKKPIIQGPGHGRIESPSTIRLSIKSKYKGLWIVIPAEPVVIEKPIIQGPGQGKIQSPNAMGLAIKSKRKG